MTDLRRTKPAPVVTPGSDGGGALLEPYRDVEERIAALRDQAPANSAERAAFARAYALLVGADMITDAESGSRTPGLDRCQECDGKGLVHDDRWCPRCDGNGLNLPPQEHGGQSDG